MLMRACRTEGDEHADGVTSVTLGKYFLNRSWSRGAIFQPMISACAPMKKSGSGILGGARPPETRRAEE